MSPAASELRRGESGSVVCPCGTRIYVVRDFKSGDFTVTHGGDVWRLSEELAFHDLLEIVMGEAIERAHRARRRERDE